MAYGRPEWERIGDTLERRVFDEFRMQYQLREEVARHLPKVDNLSRIRIFGSPNVHAIEHYRRINNTMAMNAA